MTWITIKSRLPDLMSNNQNILEGQNVRLRAIEPTDVDFIYTMENDVAIWHLGNTLMPYSRYQIEQYAIAAEHDIFAEHQLRFIIEAKTGGTECIRAGAIDLYDFDPLHKRAAIGILIIEQERQKGFASESLRLLIDYCFEVLFLHQLYCSVSVSNTVSIRLFQNAGFLQCGIRKEWRLEKDHWIDEIMFQLIKSCNYQ